MKVTCLIAETKDAQENIVYCGIIPGIPDCVVLASTRSEVKRRLINELPYIVENHQNQVISSINDGSDAEKLMGIQFKTAEYATLLNLVDLDGSLPDRVQVPLCLLLLGFIFSDRYSLGAAVTLAGSLLFMYLAYNICAWVMRKWFTRFYDKVIDAFDSFGCKDNYWNPGW